jgi:hypothetical protein
VVLKETEERMKINKIKMAYWRVKWFLRKYYNFLKSLVFDRRSRRERFFVDAHECKNCRMEHLSDSEQYELIVGSYTTEKGCWNYTRGQVFNKETGALIADVKRNYSAFPFAWAENHPNGHSYLICGEDYQGQTIIELDTGKRKDYLPLDAHNGCGFCWAEHFPSPDKTKLAVIGCFWACPYELIIYDFSDPMRLPYKELQILDAPETFSWIDNASAKIEHEREIRKSDGKYLSDLSDEEQDIAYKNSDEDYIKVKEIIKL